MKVYEVRLLYWLSGKESTCQCRRQCSIADRENPACYRAAEPVCHNCGACALCLGAAAAEPEHLRVCALQSEKPLQLEACGPQQQGSPRLPQLEKTACSNKDPAQPKINK